MAHAENRPPLTDELVKTRDPVEEENSGSLGDDSSIEAPVGVKRIEAISSTWTKWWLIAAYVRYDAQASPTRLRMKCLEE